MISSFLKNKLLHYFFPHETNNYKAKTLHINYLAIYIVFILVFQLFVSGVKKVDPNVLGYATNITVEKILELVNQQRQSEGLQPLTMSTELTTAATRKGADMFDSNYWAHISPTGTTPWHFITSSGFDYLYAGENLAKDFSTSEEVVIAWMNSPTHRANILKPEYKEIGLAVLNGNLVSDDTTLVVQEFGTRSKQNSVVEVPPDKPNSPVVLQSSTQNESNKFMISNLFTKKMSMYFVELLLIILLIDSIYIWRHKTARISSHSLSHILFLGSLIGAISITSLGAVL